jgi:filamentous hemagglutinin family protein
MVREIIVKRQAYQRDPRSEVRLLALAVASCFAPVVWANPSGGKVVLGQATISAQGKQLTIVNSPSAVIQWRGFSIKADEVTRFIQQSPSSAVLNRVVGADPSKILGTLSSNGRVFLINPNGILFGANARVDVAGLVASSLNMTDQDFLAGRLKFGDTPGAKGVENQGSIRTRMGGEVLLIAPDVKNSGVITSPQGEVILAAGKSVEIVDPKSPDLRVEITAPANEAINLGTIVADGGRISIYATSIRNAGRIQANTVERTSTGEVVLRAKKDVTLEKTSVITANGETGGKVTIQAETGTATINGVVEAKAYASPLPAGEGSGVRDS